jgi:hypothetical protein
MAGVEIDRLVLQVPGLAVDQGHRLAEKVAAGLDKARWAPAKSADKVEVAVPASPGETGLQQLADSIVAALRRQMAEGG